MSNRLRALARSRPLFTLRDASPLGRDRFVQMTDWQAAVVALVSLPYLVAYAAIGEPAAALAVFALVLCALAACALNRRGHHLLARHVLLSSANLSILAFAAWLGRASGCYLTFLIPMASTILLFPPRAWRHIAGALAQPLLMIVALHYQAAPIPVFGHAAAISIVHTSYLVSLLLTAALLLAALLAFSHAVLRSERLADEALGRLDREMGLVKLLQDVAIIANNAVELETAVHAAMLRVLRLTQWGLGRFVPFDEATWPLCAFERGVAASSASTYRDAAEAHAWCAACRGAVSAPDGLLIGVPVLVGREVAGMMQFTAAGSPPPSVEILSNLDNIGRQLGMVDERRRAQRAVNDSHIKMIAAAKMATLGEMAGGIAHEINNPLSVIQGYLARITKFQSMYSGPEASEHTDAAVGSINATIMRITRIVNGLRAFARDSTNDPFEPVTVQRLVQDTLSLSAERFRNKGVSLEIDPVPAGLTVECRSSQISQVLMNLLNNAMDAVLDLPTRDLRRVRVSAVDLGDSVDVVVSDSGPGIPLALRDKVMQPFFTTKPVGQGTGLGLSISKGIVESHHGSLEFSSRPAATEFRVRLPKEQGTLP